MHACRFVNDFLVVSAAGTPASLYPRKHSLTSLTALYSYDKILSFSQEVDLIWRRKRGGFVVPVVYTMMHMGTAFWLLIEICLPSTVSCEVRPTSYTYT